VAARPCLAAPNYRGHSCGKATGGPAMSLSPWEQHALDSIKDGLTGSDPQLTALLATFTQLASGEEMPARQPVRARTKRHPHRKRRRQHAHRTSQRLGFHLVALLLWLLITVALITTALVANRSGKNGCTELWVPVSATAHRSCPVHDTGLQAGTARGSTGT
jgi:Protein of unknown function (DUF3040)